MRSTRILTVILALGLAAAPAHAGTPDAACAADSLYLISPDHLNLYTQEDGRLGLVVSWPNMALDEATCYSLRGAEGKGFTAEVTGGFGDRVDRVLSFTTADSGMVGAAQSNPLAFTWRTVGATTYGSLGGIVNLANNGGVLRWDESAGTWSQVNAGLPMHWRQTNIAALGQGSDGVMYAGINGGQLFDTEPKGLYRFNGTAWGRVGADVFDASRRVTVVAVDPTNSDRVAVGSALGGLYVSSDGGATFTNWAANLDPGFPAMPTTFAVTAVAWNGGRLFAAVANLGVFVSSDGGGSFSRSALWVWDNLDRIPANRVPTLPLVNTFTIDPANPDRILAALYFHGAYESTDGGVTWHDLYGNLNVPDPERPGSWSHTGQSVAIDPGDPQVLVMGVEAEGLYRSGDGGGTWTLVAADLQPTNTGQLRRLRITSSPGRPGRFLAMEDKWRLLESTDGGLNWQVFGVPPVLNTMASIQPSPTGTGDLLLGTWAGGIYVPGTPLTLARTYSNLTSAELRSLELGLDITFSAGTVARGDAFELICQTFQGWAVWRAPSADPTNMKLLGLFDRVNPETCIEGYCGDVNYDPVPQCFAAKRAACFDTSNPDTIRFFDSEIYNGFSYFYAVSSFDYGNTALTSPENNSNAMLFSPRAPDDDESPFPGPGNRTYYRVDLGTEPVGTGDEIYVYPNPLRLDSGVPGEDGRTVIWTNLPPGSRVRVFTTAGDDVINIGPDSQHGGQIYWWTDNRDHEPIAPGVYLYKVEMPQREPYWGRLVVIR